MQIRVYTAAGYDFAANVSFYDKYIVGAWRGELYFCITLLLQMGGMINANARNDNCKWPIR